MGPEFIAAPGADAWQLSNPPILALAPVRVSLELFAEAGMDALRVKSLALTGYLAEALEACVGDITDIITPAEPQRRGCQLSLRIRAGREAGRALFEHLEAAGVVADWREPDVIRVAPVPLYNRYQDAWRLVEEIAVWRDRA